MPRTRSNVIRILNPVAEGHRYTTSKSAARFVERGIAVWAEGRRSIRMTRNQELCAIGRSSIAHELARQQDDRLVSQRKGGMVWWNGADQRDSAMHPPFRNVQFPRIGIKVAA